MNSVKKYVFLIIAVITLTIGANAFAATGEAIDNFQTSILVNTDGSLNVTETITYNFGDSMKHGIIRDIQDTFTNQDGKNFKKPVEVVRVINELNVPYNFVVTGNGAFRSVKIGDADTLVSDTKVYVIEYKVTGAIERFSDHDEIYWNVTGNGWDVPINKAGAAVSLPNDVPQASIKTACYTGVYGSKEQECEGGGPALGGAAPRPLSPGEGLTIVVGFEPGHVTITPKTSAEPVQEADQLTQALIVAGIILWYVIAPLAVVVIYFLRGRDPKIATSIPALFDAPKDKDTHARVTPGEAGTLIDESADNHDISATIVDLAIRGYLTIKEEKGDGIFADKNFTFTKKAPTGTSPLQPHEELLLNALFGSANTTSTKSLKNSFAQESQKIKDSLYSQLVAAGYFAHNPHTVRNIWIGIGLVALFTINIPFGIVAVIFAKTMPRKTLKGVRALTDIKGLKLFLASQKKQLEFQEENWFLFEKLLPYAIAFGVAEIWAKRFAQISAPQDLTWYHGYSTLNALTLAATMDSFDSNIGSVATPTRSYGGFSSGFGGGGFSGGGFGGGGGGRSW